MRLPYDLERGSIYFVRRADDTGPVKIGFSKQPQSRFEVIDRSSPVPMQLLALLAGTIRTERRFHARFLPWHIRHEWFEATPALLRVIAGIRDGTFDLETLPEPTMALCSVRVPRGTRPNQLRAAEPVAATG